MNFKSKQGGCLCGQSRYELSKEPITLYACHCTDCQTASGSSCVLGMRIPSDGIKVVLGDPKPYERTRADGRTKLSLDALIVLQHCGELTCLQERTLHFTREP